MLTVENLRKTYGATEALRSLTFQADSNTILGIIGPNGAGKSTLTKVLAGEEREDSGGLSFNGLRLSQERRRQIVAVVHQEPQLFPNMTVAANLMIGREGLARPRPTPEVQELLRRLHIGDVADELLETASIVVWQLTEIARALLRSAEIFVFDEPNSALTQEESQQLFEHMRSLRAAGKLVILVSHRLAEVSEICEQVVAVRDGNVAAIICGDDITTDNLATVLTADEIDRPRLDAPTSAVQSEPITVHAAMAGSPATEKVADRQRDGERISICGVRGVVVAVTGPEGGGGREVVRGVSLEHESSSHVRRAYMASDRRQSLFFNMSVAANIAARLDRSKLTHGRKLLARRTLVDRVHSYIQDFEIKAAHPGVIVGSLSGGNQQKVALAGALAVEPDLLVIEEPTRGVDIGTKAQIFEIVRQFARSGGAVVMFVTELEDALGCADRLFVVSDGAVRGSLAVSATTNLEVLTVAVNRMLKKQTNAA